MYWVSKYRKLLAVAFLVAPFASNAQTVTSPYSILGIGDVETGSYDRYFGSGGNGIGRRNNNSYNLSNPAALTALPIKLMHFDIGFRGRSSRFEQPNVDSASALSKDMTVKQISLAFRSSDKIAVAFGLQPFSTVNYQYNRTRSILDGNSSYQKSIEGSGGINRIYLSVAKSFGNHLSAGVSGGWLFGTLQQVTDYSADDLSLSIQKEDQQFFNGASAKLGLQYYSLASRKWQHSFGLTAEYITDLFGQKTVDYLENGTSIDKIISNDQRFLMPLQFGLGYTISNRKLSLSLDGRYSAWPVQSLDYSQSYTNEAWRYGAGLEYSITSKRFPDQEAAYLSVGFRQEKTYMVINNSPLQDQAFSLGAGLNMSSSISIRSGIELGRKGNLGANQIRENYVQYQVGITVKNLWFGQKHLPQYD